MGYWEPEKRTSDPDTSGWLLTNGLVGWWQFNEGEGTIASDSSVYSNDGDIVGASWVDGKYGKAINLNGSTDFVEVSDDVSLHLSEITISVWIKRGRINTEEMICSKYDGNYNEWYLYILSNNRFGLLIGDGSDNSVAYSVSPTYDLDETGVWYHLVGTFDGTNLKLYLNGVDVTDGSVTQDSLNNYTNVIRIGKASWYDGLHFDGIIDEVRIYDHALTPDEILQEYIGKHGRIWYNTTSGKIKYWDGSEIQVWDTTSGGGGGIPSGDKYNGIWTGYTHIDSSFYNKCVGGNIKQAFLNTGEWNTSYGIDYFVSDGEITTFVNACHAVNMQAVAWVHYRYDSTRINITQSSDRTTMANAAVGCLNKGFDVFEDDLEPYNWETTVINIVAVPSESWYADYADLLNKIGTAAHGVSKEAHAAINVSNANPVEDIFDNVTELDASKIMLYNGGTYSQSEIQTVLGRVLPHTSIQISAGLMVPFSSGILTSIDNVIPLFPTYNDWIIGYGIFEYADMNTSDWTTWNNWITKDF